MGNRFFIGLSSRMFDKLFVLILLMKIFIIVFNMLVIVLLMLFVVRVCKVDCRFGGMLVSLIVKFLVVFVSVVRVSWL